jgi:hypothetical protein
MSFRPVARFASTVLVLLAACTSAPGDLSDAGSPADDGAMRTTITMCPGAPLAPLASGVCEVTGSGYPFTGST